MELCGRIQRLARVIDKSVKASAAAHGVEHGEFDVLTTLQRSGPPYALTAGAFLKASMVTSGAITNRIDRMEAKGLVERVRDTADRRTIKIRLTDHGHEVTCAAFADHLANYARLLAALRARPGGEHLVGIRHQVQSEPDPDWLLRPDVRRGLRAVADVGIVYDLVILPHQLPAATTAARELPELAFVLDHGAKPPVASGALEPWATRLRAFAALPNTTGKLSGLHTEADWRSWTVRDLRPYADTLLDAFGPRRLMYGSDWPVCTLAASYGRTLATARKLLAALSDTERTAVLGGTAAETYRLGEVIARRADRPTVT